MQYDLKEIQKSLTPAHIIKLLNYLGATEYIEKDDYLIFRTICHNLMEEEGSMKLYYYKNTGLFNCFTDCGECFNIYTLFEKVYKLRGREYKFSDIVHTITNITDIKDQLTDFEGTQKYRSINDRYKRKQRKKEFEIYDPGVLKIFSKRYPVEWITDGITPAAIDKFNILYSISRNKIIIPHYYLDGSLIGIRGRALNQEDIELGKYMPIEIEGKWYNSPLSMNLYGLNINADNIRKQKKVIIAEGEKSVLQFDSMTDSNICVATCGSSINKNQIDLLVKNFDINEIILAFDKEYINYNDEQGKKYFAKLEQLCRKYKNYANFSFIFDKENLLNEKDSPFDKGKDIFYKLYEKRIRME